MRASEFVQKVQKKDAEVESKKFEVTKAGEFIGRVGVMEGNILYITFPNGIPDDVLKNDEYVYEMEGKQ